MRNRPAGPLMAAALVLSSLGLAGCAADRNACYESVEREYGQVMMPVPCPSEYAAESGG